MSKLKFTKVDNYTTKETEYRIKFFEPDTKIHLDATICEKGIDGEENAYSVKVYTTDATGKRDILDASFCTLKEAKAYVTDINDNLQRDLDEMER